MRYVWERVLRIALLRRCRQSVEFSDLEEMLLRTEELREHVAALADDEGLEAYMKRSDALGCFAPKHVLRQTAHKVISSPVFKGVVLLVITVSCVLMAMETPGVAGPAWMETWDQFALAVFTLEMVLKVLDLGLFMDSGTYLRSGWNLLDFFIVVVGYLDITLSAVATSVSLSQLKALRLLRTLRPLRLIARAEGLRDSFNCFVASIPAGGQVSVLLSCGALIFGTVAVMRFGGKFHLCSDSELWTAQWVTSWVRGNETVEVRDWLDCIGGAGMVWRTPPMNFDDVSISLKTLFETATFSGYSDMLVSAIMVKGYGVQPSNKLSVSASAEACFFIFLWLVFGGLVVRPFCITVHLLWLTRMSAGSQSVHGGGRRNVPGDEG
jgi:hypothetical protein